MGIFGGSPDREELLELQARVARLEEQVARLQAGSAATTATAPATAVRPDSAASEPADPYAEARALAAQGKKIPAIKAVRDATGLGLKQAKDLVESW